MLDRAKRVETLSERTDKHFMISQSCCSIIYFMIFEYLLRHFLNFWVELLLGGSF
jgi:hypothetical protein